ncbi:MAG: hypothetical protein K0S32_17 [Bacteroidetes bacterium]|jgi:hypothetical protein|nr:hypothetical protein [Bacteroidota bacterium]
MNLFRTQTLNFKKECFLLVCCILLSSVSFSQNKSVPATVPTYYLLPAQISSGVLHMHVKFTYYFEKISIGGKYHMVLRVNTMAEPSSQYGEYFYRYEDRNFSHNDLAKEDGLATTGFSQIQLTNLMVEVFVNSGQNARTKTILFDTEIGHAELWDVEADEDPSKYSLQFKDLKKVYVKNDDVVKKRVQNYLKISKNRDEYKKYLDKGDLLFNSKNLAGAKFNYSNALKLFPNEQYPKDQLQKIQDEEEKLKSTVPKSETTAGSTQKEQPKSTLGHTTTSSVTNTSSNTNSGVAKPSSSSYGSSGNTGSTQNNQTSNSSGKMTDAEAKEYFNKNVIQNTPYSNTTYSNTSSSQAVGNFANTLNNYAAQQQAIREREAMEKRQERMEAEAQRKAVAARKYLLSKFTDGNMPLSSQTPNTDEVYFFIYNHNPQYLESSSTVFFVSNVFSVQKYKDGTWPFRDKLSAQFPKMNFNGNPWTLCGFYSGKEEAETQRQYFMNGMIMAGCTNKDLDQQSLKPVYNAFEINSWGNIAKPGSVATQSFLPLAKYEEAELAFSKSDYALALSRLDETESYLKTKEPKVLYLRIMSQMELINKDMYNDYSIIEDARKNSNYYIDNFSKTIEEKYVDVINASKQLDQLPRSKEYFDVLKEQHLEKLRKEEEARRLAEEQKRWKEEQERKAAQEIAERKAMKEAKERNIQNARVIGYSGGKFAPLGICYYKSKHNGMGLYMSVRGLIEKDPKLNKNSSYRNYCMNAGITANILHPVGWYMAAGISNFKEVDLRNPFKPILKDWGAGLDISTGLIIHVSKIKLQLGTSIYGWMDVPPEFCFGIGYGF